MCRLAILAFLILALSCDVRALVFTDGNFVVRWLTDSHTLTGLGVPDCYVYDVRNTSKPYVPEDPTELVYTVEDTAIRKHINHCVDVQGSQPPLDLHHVQKRGIFDIFKGIYPGTKWCGIGNIADHIDDLGEYRDTDKCCRDHDNYCEDYIVDGDTKYGVHNNIGYTICDCECNEKFRVCLQSVRTFVSWAVGKGFFNVAEVKCLMKRNTSDPGVFKGELVTSDRYSQKSKTSLADFNQVINGQTSFGSWLSGLFGRRRLL